MQKIPVFPGVCLMLGCSLVCVSFHVTIIISLYFMLLLNMVLFIRLCIVHICCVFLIKYFVFGIFSICWVYFYTKQMRCIAGLQKL